MVSHYTQLFVQGTHPTYGHLRPELLLWRLRRRLGTHLHDSSAPVQALGKGTEIWGLMNAQLTFSLMSKETFLR